MEVYSTSDLKDLKNYTVLLYGDNRSGKTHFAGKWPRPLFLVPQVAIREMRTVMNSGYTVVPFHTIEEFKKRCAEVSKSIIKGKPIGAYTPRTIVIDNVTTAQMTWEEEIKSRRQVSKLEWSDWDVVKSALSFSMIELMKAPVHLMWITHCRLLTMEDPTDPKKKLVEGRLTIDGKARDFLPNHADMLLYAEQIDRGARGSRWLIHGRKKGPYSAGVRLPTTEGVEPFSRIESTDKFGEAPNYDQLVPYLDLPTVDEDWEQYTESLEPKIKTKKGTK